MTDSVRSVPALSANRSTSTGSNSRPQARISNSIQQSGSVQLMFARVADIPLVDIMFRVALFPAFRRAMLERAVATSNKIDAVDEIKMAASAVSQP